MRSGLAKLLDDVLLDVIPPILEPSGFKTVARRRLWKREDDRCDQAVAVHVDGRAAREGSLDVFLEFGITYAFETELSYGPVVAGRCYVHLPAPISPDGSTPLWRFREKPITEHHGDVPRGYRVMHPLTLRGELAEYLPKVVVPALDRFRDPRLLRDHLLVQGRLYEAIELSAAVGDAGLARELVPAYLSWVARWLAHYAPHTQPSLLAQEALDLADAHGARLSGDDEALLRHAADPEPPRGSDGPSLRRV